MLLGRWGKQRRGSGSGVLGIEIQPQGISYVYLQSGEQPVVKAHDMLLAANQAGAADLLIERVTALGLKGCYCQLLLSPQDYTLLLIESPAVEADELVDAVRWKIKDLVSQPLESLSIDLFQLPLDSNRAGQKMLYVVVAETARIKSMIELVKIAQLNLQAIDIPEMAVRNLVERLDNPSVDKTVAVVRVLADQATLMLYKGSALYLSRRFDINYAGGLFDDLPVDQLTLEIQRSLDYFERQMGQVPPKNIFLTGENITSDKITDYFKDSLAASLELLDEAFLPHCQGETQLLNSYALTTVGVALRAEHRTEQGGE